MTALEDLTKQDDGDRPTGDAPVEVDAVLAAPPALGLAACGHGGGEEVAPEPDYNHMIPMIMMTLCLLLCLQV